MRRQLLTGLRMTVVLAIILGLIYPLVMTAAGQALFPRQANGSEVKDARGQVVGSSLLGQSFTDAKGNPVAKYFQPRPSAAIVSGAKGDYGCDPLYSSASNFGPNNPTFVQTIKQRQQQISKLDHVPVSQIPANAVTASGSGLDPQISPANAAIQVDRVAAARHVSPEAIQALVSQYTQGRTLGFLGEPGVNVLELNIALDQQYPVS